MSEAQAYIVEHHDTDNAAAVKMTEDQKKALEWLIDWADLNISVGLPNDMVAVDLTKEE